MNVKFLLTSLKNKKEIKKLFNQGLIISNSFFIFKYLPNKTNVSIRFVISTSKKIFPTAVKRNKIKRQIRVFMKQIDNFNRSIDLLVIVKKAYDVNNFIKNGTSFKSLISKII